MNIGLTYIKDIDLKIVGYLPDLEIEKMRLINKYFFELLEDDHFWMNRTIEKYSKDLGTNEEIKSYKEERSNSWKSYYDHLRSHEFGDIDGKFITAVKDTKVDIVKLLIEGVNYMMINIAFKDCVKKENIEIIKIIIEKSGPLLIFDKNYKKCLKIASQQKNKEIYDILIEFLASCNDQA